LEKLVRDGVATIARSGGHAFFQALITADAATIDAGTFDLFSHVFAADPLFANAAAADYHLRIDSPAIDTAGFVSDTDFDGFARPVDILHRGTSTGDLGAFERQSGDDALFSDGFDG
jgi:hypothetical protein